MGGFVTLLKRSFASFGSDKCATYSAAIAYYTIFSLFPMALVGISVLGFFVGDASARDSVVEGLSGVITLGEDGEEAFRNTLANVNAAKGWIGLIGLAGALWSASGLFGAIRTALDNVWDVDRPLPMLRAKVRDLLLFIGFGGLLAASTASTGLLQGARTAGAGWLGPLNDVAGPVFALLAFIAPLLLTFAAFIFLYRVAPHARLNWGDVVPAALLAALFFEFGKNLLAFYILRVGNASVLAGSLGGAILLLVFIYYAAQVVLLSAELSKHYLLVREGTLPATDPKVDAPKIPFGQKVKGMITRLWSVDEAHHDAELPYEPARLDPVTNRPTNTREEVMVKWQKAEENARRDAADAGRPAPRAGTTNGARPSLQVIAGEARRLGDKLIVQSETKVTPLSATSDVKVTRNGKKASLKAIKVGDWVMVTAGPDGKPQMIDASDAMTLKTSPQNATGAGTDWTQVAGMLVPVVVAAVRGRRSDDDDEKNGKDDKDGKNDKVPRSGRRPKSKEPYPMLRRKPTN